MLITEFDHHTYDDNEGVSCPLDILFNVFLIIIKTRAVCP